jgi:hypothetical protein
MGPLPPRTLEETILSITVRGMVIVLEQGTRQIRAQIKLCLVVEDLSILTKQI